MNQALSGLKNAKSVVGFMQTYEVNSDEKNSGIFETHGKKRMYSKTSLFCLRDTNTMRKTFVWLATWKWFDAFITLAIVLNSIMLATTDY